MPGEFEVWADQFNQGDLTLNMNEPKEMILVFALKFWNPFKTLTTDWFVQTHEWQFDDVSCSDKAGFSEWLQH